MVAIERDATRLEMAQANVRLYSVAAKVEWRCADGLEALAALDPLDGDLVFVDPPWGEAWDRAHVDPFALPLLNEARAARGGRGLWAKLPPSTDTPLARPVEMHSASRRFSPDGLRPRNEDRDPVYRSSRVRTPTLRGKDVRSMRSASCAPLYASSSVISPP